jgi:hypothetical protein
VGGLPCPQISVQVSMSRPMTISLACEYPLGRCIATRSTVSNAGSALPLVKRRRWAPSISLRPRFRDGFAPFARTISRTMFPVSILQSGRSTSSLTYLMIRMPSLTMFQSRLRTQLRHTSLHHLLALSVQWCSTLRRIFLKSLLEI